MAQVITGLKDKNVDEKITYGETLETSLTGNPNITVDPGKLTELTDAKTLLETNRHTAKLAQQASLAAFQAQNASEKAFDVVVSDISKIVNATLKDPEKLLTTGYPLKDEGGPVGELPAPENFSVTYGDAAGQLDSQWDRVGGAVSYLLQINLTDPENENAWSEAGTPTQTKHTIENLTSGDRAYMRVIAIGTAGKGDPCSYVSKIVP